MSDNEASQNLYRNPMVGGSYQKLSYLRDELDLDVLDRRFINTYHSRIDEKFANKTKPISS